MAWGATWNAYISQAKCTPMMSLGHSQRTLKSLKTYNTIQSIATPPLLSVPRSREKRHADSQAPVEWHWVSSLHWPVDDGAESRDTARRALRRPSRSNEPCPKTVRCRQGSNLCGQSPMDFKSIALTTRPRQPHHGRRRSIDAISVVTKLCLSTNGPRDGVNQPRETDIDCS